MPESWQSLARRIAAESGIDPSLFVRLVQQESGGDPRAVSPAGAQGLTQLMPATARGLGVSDPFDPEQNLRGGARFLRSMLDRYRGDYRLALAAYNAGPGNVDKYGDVPPFEETQQYVRILTPTGGPKTQLSVQAQTGGTVEPSAKRTQLEGLLAERRRKEADLVGKVGELSTPGDDETTTSRLASAQARAEAARRAREQKLQAAQSELSSVRSSINQIEMSIATEAPSKPAPGDPSTYKEVRDPNTGRVVKLQDPATGQIIDLPDPAKPKVPGQPDITVLGGKPYTVETVTQQDANGNVRSQVVLTPVPGFETAPKEPKAPDSRQSGRHVIERQPDGTWTQVYEFAREEPTPRDPTAVARDQAEIARITRQNTDARALALQGIADTVQQLQGMYQRGEIEMSEMTTYVTAAKAQIENALRGSTPFEEAKERRMAEEGRRRAGVDVIQQRLSSGASLASSLLQAAGGARMAEGQTSLGVDLFPILDELQGGADVTPYAKSLLTGAGASPVGPVVNSPPGGFSVVTDPGVSGMRAGLQAGL